MSTITSGNAEQYGNSHKLAARARLNSEYMIAEVGWFEWVARQLPLGPEMRVLDVGCGPGWFWAGTADERPSDLALNLCDLSPGMVQEAVERCRTLPFGSVSGHCADAAALPFEDAAFDAVVAMHMFYHLADPACAMAEIHRVLKPGGFLALTSNGADNMRGLYALTTVFGSAPTDPSALAFDFAAAEGLMQAQFGNVTISQHPARLCVTDPEDVFLALTSYPPGDTADEATLSALRAAIAAAFRSGNGALGVEKQSGLFVSRKTSTAA